MTQFSTLPVFILHDSLHSNSLVLPSLYFNSPSDLFWKSSVLVYECALYVLPHSQSALHYPRLITWRKWAFCAFEIVDSKKIIFRDWSLIFSAKSEKKFIVHFWINPFLFQKRGYSTTLNRSHKVTHKNWYFLKN